MTAHVSGRSAAVPSVLLFSVVLVIHATAATGSVQVNTPQHHPSGQSSNAVTSGLGRSSLNAVWPSSRTEHGEQLDAQAAPNRGTLQALMPAEQVDIRSNQLETQPLDNLHNSNSHMTMLDVQALLRRLNHYKFNASPTALKMGLGHDATWRMHRFAHKLLTGEPVTVGAVGGSITFGQCTDRGINDWFSLLMAWLKETFPDVQIKGSNNAVPATPSVLMLGCSRDLGVDHSMDLMFVEYVINDNLQEHNVSHGPFNIERPQMFRWEQLIRKFLNLPNQPALVHMAVTAFRFACGGAHFFETPEDQYNIVAQYYGVGTLSLRNVVLQYRLLNQSYLNGTFSYDQWLDKNDCGHPNKGGHRIMADLAIMTIRNALLHVLRRGYSPMQKSAATSPIPPPLFKDNEAPEEGTCIFAPALEPLVVDSNGFSLINEGTAEKPKFGFISSVPGSHLAVTVQGKPGSTQSLSILHLKSYAHMGLAKVECVEYCQCDPESRVLDGVTPMRYSQVFGSTFGAMTSQTGACTLRFTVLNETNSGEHKFKLSGIMVGGTWTDNLAIPLE